MHITNTASVEVMKFKRTDKMRWSLKANGLFKMGTLPADTFMKFSTKGQLLAKYSVDSLNRYFAKVLPTVSESEVKPIFTGVLLDGNFVSTDQTRLSCYKVGSQQKPLIIPPAIADVLTSFSNLEAEISNMEGQNGLLIRVGDTMISTRLLEGMFPDYKSVIDGVEKLATKCLMINKSEFKAVMDRLAGFRDINNTVLFEIKEGKLTLQIGGSDSAREEVTGVNFSEPMEMDLYLPIDSVYDFIGVLDGDYITMKIADSRKPVLVVESYENGEEFQCMVSCLCKR